MASRRFGWQTLPVRLTLDDRGQRVRRVLAEQQHAVAAFGPAGSLARDAQHVEEVTQVDQPGAQHACGARHDPGVQHIPIADERKSMGTAAGHGAILAPRTAAIPDRWLYSRRSSAPRADAAYCFNEFTGELLAIREFNEAHADRKLAQIAGLRHYFRSLPTLWHEQMYVAHLFKHPHYNTPVHSRNHRAALGQRLELK